MKGTTNHHDNTQQPRVSKVCFGVAICAAFLLEAIRPLTAESETLGKVVPALYVANLVVMLLCVPALYKKWGIRFLSDLVGEKWELPVMVCIFLVGTAVRFFYGGPDLLLWTLLLVGGIAYMFLRKSERLKRFLKQE